MSISFSQGAVRHESLTTNSRFECKYIIDPLIVPAQRQFLQSVARVDPFGSARQDRRYPVCSLYLDTEDLRYYRQYINGERYRLKLRVRTYSDDPDAPAFLEVKSRVNRVVTKRRVRMTRQEARDVLGRRSTAGVAWQIRRREVPDLDYFVDEMTLATCRPVVGVKYLREAYVGMEHEPVRVTFDTALQHQATSGPSLALAEGPWTPTPIRGVILEVKFTGRFPSWIEQMVRAFGLKQERCCKFALSIEQMLARGRASFGSAAPRLPRVPIGTPL